MYKGALRSRVLEGLTAPILLNISMNDIKLVSYNIRFGLGLDQRINLERTAKAIQDADIIALQEVERFWKRSGMTDQPEILSEHLKDFYWSYCPAFDVDASERLDGVIVNRRRQFGTMILSRWPIIMSRSIVFPKLGTVHEFNMDTGAIECIIDTPSGTLRVYSVHLSAISKQDRLLQLDYLLSFYRGARVSGGAWTGGYPDIDRTKDQFSLEQNWSNDETSPLMPNGTIMMGDFNCGPDSEEYEKMVGSMDPCRGRIGHLNSFVDGWITAKSRLGGSFTWKANPENNKQNKGLRLDYCFVNPILSKNVEEAWIDKDADGSDHQPVWIKLKF